MFAPQFLCRGVLHTPLAIAVQIVHPLRIDLDSVALKLGDRAVAISNVKVLVSREIAGTLETRKNHLEVVCGDRPL